MGFGDWKANQSQRRSTISLGSTAPPLFPSRFFSCGIELLTGRLLDSMGLD